MAKIEDAIRHWRGGGEVHWHGSSLATTNTFPNSIGNTLATDGFKLVPITPKEGSFLWAMARLAEGKTVQSDRPDSYRMKNGIPRYVNGAIANVVFTENEIKGAWRVVEE